MPSLHTFASKQLVTWIAMFTAVGCATNGQHPVGSAKVNLSGNADPRHNLLGTYDFGNGIMLPWMTSFTPPAHGNAAIKDGAMCLTVEEPGKDRWDAQLRHRQMVMLKGHTYQLAFKVRSSRTTRVAVKVGMSGPPYTDYWTRMIPVTENVQAVSAGFRMTHPDDATVELALHAGGSMVTGNDPVELCFDDLVLSDAEFTPSPPAAAAFVPKVRVNQLGYLPHASKLAVWVTSEQAPKPWKLGDATGQVIAKGETAVHGADATSGDFVHLIDFTNVTRQAVGLTLHIGSDQSDPFAIGASLFRPLARDALRFFYHHRSGFAIEMPYAGRIEWAHPAGHKPERVQCQGNCGLGYTLDVAGGWYDAGDQGKYVVNGGLTVWLLQNAFERNALLTRNNGLFLDNAAGIPESNNGFADILDESRWEVEFLLKMQVPPGHPLSGMAHHKVHDDLWTALGTAPQEDKRPRVLRPPSTAATLNLAAVAAQAARLWRNLDAEFAARCLSAAHVAWNAAKAHPDIFAPAADSTGGGAYEDDNVEDEFYWAAAELYLTTGDPAYQRVFINSPLDGAIAPDLLLNGRATTSALTWQRVDVLGKLSLALAPNPVAKARADVYRKQLRDAADTLLATLAHQGYRFPMEPGSDGGYPWGSNSWVLGNMVILGAAADYSHSEQYASGVVSGMDYLLGRNAVGKSYVSGYGTRPLLNPHHRFWAHQANSKYPTVPPGLIAGGPNSHMQDPYIVAAGLKGSPVQKCYIDHIEAYSVNEIAINWNAALVWTAIWLDDYGTRGLLQ